MQEMVVLYPDFVKVIKAIKHKRDRCHIEGKGAGIMVFMPSGAGKSFICRYLLEKWPPNHDGEVSKVPVVTFQPPVTLSENKMCQALLSAIGDPLPSAGDTEDKMKRIKYLVEKLETKVICLDNAHDIVQKRLDKGVINLGTWLRDLIEMTEALVVMLGTSAAKPLVGRNSQIGRRGRTRFHLKHFNLDSKAEISKFKRFLHELDKLLPLAKMSGLAEDDRLLRIFWATNGIQSFIFDLVTEATIHAVNEKHERLTKADFEAAFDLLYGDEGKGMNPFTKSCRERVLDQEGEIFHEWFDLYNPDPESTLTFRTRG